MKMNLRPKPPQPDIAALDLEANFVRRVGLYAALVFLFLKVSSLHEIVSGLTGVSLRLMYVLVPPAVLGMALSGGIGRTLSHKSVWLWLGFTLWAAVGVPFSSWPGGSAEGLFRFVRTELLTCFLIAGSVATWKECGITLKFFAFAIVIPILFALKYSSGQRLGFDFQGSIANPNTLAAHILLFLPVVVYFALRPEAGALVRLACTAVCLAGAYAVLRTGSRGGMIAFAVQILVFFCMATPRQRIATGLLAIFMGAFGLLLLPAETLQRLTTFSAGSDATLEAVQSAESRKYLFRKSLEFTFQYPIFGVGMGQFSTFEGVSSRAAGERGNWHEAHNAYTEVSSECGIPAFVLFLGAILGTLGIFRYTLRAARLSNADMALALRCLLVGMAGFCTAATFLSVAYTFYLPAMTGLAIAFRHSLTAPRTVQPQIPALPLRRHSPALP